MRNLFLYSLLLVLSSLVNGDIASVNSTCIKIGNKLSSVSVDDCLRHDFNTGGETTGGHQLLYKDFKHNAGDEKVAAGRVLLVGGIHGDEFSSISIVFKWLSILSLQPSTVFDWKVIPAANPDGLLSSPGIRQNKNGIDLNRNFPTQEWQKKSQQYWKSRNFNPRRFPGKKAASEAETQWLMSVIERFNPDVIIAIHAPYSLLDFDGPPKAPENLGALQLNQLGIYPGSLGNYGSKCLNKQVVTLELASAGTLPSEEETKRMWRDLLRWLVNNHEYHQQDRQNSNYKLNTECGE